MKKLKNKITLKKMKSKSLAGTEMFPDETLFSFADYYPS
mgnify:FL=1